MDRKAAPTFVPPDLQMDLALASIVDIGTAMRTNTFECSARGARRGPRRRLPAYGRGGIGRGQLVEVFDLAGELHLAHDAPARVTGGEPSADPIVEVAFANATVVQQFYAQVFDRDSIMGDGMPCQLHVHVGEGINNAEWNDACAMFGDGDGKRFKPFALSLEVVAHELSHGVIRLDYLDASGALNESFADVMAAMVVQWHDRLPVERANWVIGSETVMPALGIPGVRTFTAKPAFEGVGGLKGDAQPKHMDGYVHTTDDYGGVHVNCGIPNHAFYLAATKIGGNAWELAGRIWYESLTKLECGADFQAAAAKTVWTARELLGSPIAADAFRDAWRQVGIEIEQK